MNELKDLTEEQKEDLVNQVNKEAESEENLEEGNTSIFNMSDIDENAGEGSAQAQYEKSVTANAKSLHILDQVLNKKGAATVSRKNLIKLVFATLKLPEEGATLKFGGTREDKQLCEFAYAQMQLAANTRAFILGVDAMRMQRRAMKEAEAEKQKQQESEKSEDKENTNE